TANSQSLPASGLHLAELALNRALLGLAGAAVRGAIAARRALCAVHGLTDLLQRRVELIHRPRDCSVVGALQGSAYRRDLALDLRLEVGRDLVLVVLQRLLGAVGQAVRLVTPLDRFTTSLVLGRVHLG